MSDQLKSIFIVSAGEMQIPAIKAAKDLGYHVIASDKNEAAAGFKYADVALVMDTKDCDAHVNYALKHKDQLNIVGAFAAADVAITVAAITTALNLPGISTEVAYASNNKSVMKKHWLKDGVSTPYSVEVRTIAEAKTVIEAIGFPVMVKAIDNAASRGNKKIVGFEELEDALEDAKRHSTTNSALIEEFVEGQEYSVETIVFNGVHYHYGIAERHFGFSPYAIETGHTNPAKLSKELEDSIYDVVDRAAKSLGITFGPAKADMIVTRKGPMILEMPARLSGGWHSQFTTPLSMGLDPIRDVLNMCAGGSIDSTDNTPKFSRSSICKAIFPKPGKIVRINGVSEAEKIEGVEKIILVVKEGDVIEDYHNCAQRVCYIITVGETAEQANEIWEKAANTVSIETVSY